jgi:hypothetical protein
MWSPVAKAFQSLEFKFLDTVDVKFANSIREDGRLESFRALLRKVGNDGAGGPQYRRACGAVVSH